MHGTGIVIVECMMPACHLKVHECCLKQLACKLCEKDERWWLGKGGQAHAALTQQELQFQMQNVSLWVVCNVPASGLSKPQY